ncbi:MAB_1171c family putative transporter [Streptomyces sp. HMX87]|uniref:MAB_1171c family putative transporter n=1 Tax=Streptomyces sp. HMX87 TaxID=3390849 RepID=UPI003A858BB3
MPWDIAGHHVVYAVPAALGTTALVMKLPLLRRAWHDPILRATALLLVIGVVNFLSLPPPSLHLINRITGVPNFAAPWAYSLLTAYCGACLWLVLLWKNPPSATRRRQIRAVAVCYAAVIVGLWTTFLLADARVERLRDLDTYYANTPWMREHIVLYLLAHLVSAVVTAGILWAWFKEIDQVWLRRAVVLLQLAYALGFLYDIAKLTAVAARWTGRNWDWLSTYAAPPFAFVEAVLVAVGFIAGQAGPPAQDRLSAWRTHRRLAPLWELVRTVSVPPAPATGRVSGIALQLEMRRAAINDGLLALAPHLSRSRRDLAYRRARAAGHPEPAARGIADAVDLTVAVDAVRSGRAAPASAGHPPPTGAAPGRLGPDSELESIAHALRCHAADVESIRRQAAATEGLSFHA